METAPERRSLLRVPYVQVLIAVALGVAVGALWPETGASLKPLGDAFIKLVKMVIGPVIFCTVVSGIAGMRDLKKVGRVGGKALLYFELVSTLALALGLLVANTVAPGHGFDAVLTDADRHAVDDYASRAHHESTLAFVLGIIPETLVGAFADGNILQVLLVSILSGVALAGMGAAGEPLLALIHLATEAIFGIVKVVMKAAPIGAFGAMAFTIGRNGLGSIGHLAELVATFYLTATLFVVLVLGAIARLCGFSIFRFLRLIKDELLIVLGTSSSESALPSLMKKLESIGCSRSVVGLVVPTGYSFNLDGTNLYMTLAALFIAQATNTPLTLEQELTILGVAMLTSKGATGVTGSGFVTLAATLSAVPAIPVAGMALILGVDRFMSECRALTNIIGNGVATVVVSRWEKELDPEKLAAIR